MCGDQGLETEQCNCGEHHDPQHKTDGDEADDESGGDGTHVSSIAHNPTTREIYITKSPDRGNNPGQLIGHALSVFRAGRFHHHAHQIFRARRPQQHPPVIAELRLDARDSLLDL